MSTHPVGTRPVGTAVGPDVLWLSAELPDVPHTGAHRYSRGLRAGLARTGAAVVVLGIGSASGDEEPSVRRAPVGGSVRPWPPSLLSRLPNCAYVVATPAYRRAVEGALAARPWDAVVVDHLQMAWAVRAFPRLGSRRGGLPLLAVTHNHETGVRRSVALGHQRLGPRGVVLRHDARKSAALERDLLRAADVATAITDTDAEAFGVTDPATPVVVVPPGYDDPHLAPRPMRDRERRVVIVGSFDWHVKAENLRRFVLAADPVFAAAGIRLDIVGRTPPGFVAGLGHEPIATTFLGWVDDLADVLGRARLAVVSEPDGGGFKMKSLDYLFHHVPTAVLAGSADGLGLVAGTHHLEAATEDGLARLIVATIDDTDRLDRMATAAYARAAARFSWEHSGAQLRDALDRMVPVRSAG